MLVYYRPMALTITKTFASKLRLRYQFDASADGFADSLSLTQAITDSVPGPLRTALQRVAAQGNPSDDPEALQRLFSSGGLRAELIDAIVTDAKILVTPVWGVLLHFDGTDYQFSPSQYGGGTGGRAYWDLYVVHTING
jgi:hypothetical protein